MGRKCYRCGDGGHLKRDCPRNRLHVVPGPESPARATEPQISDPLDLSCQPRINQEPDLSSARAYWDTSAPLVPIEEAWWGRPADTPAQVAREMRLRAEAARQVAESRAARGGFGDAGQL